MKKIAIATALSLGFCGSAFAVTADSGVYIGGLAGWSFAAAPNTSSTQMNATSESNKNYTLGATIGYEYAFTQNWMTGLEGSYVYFGKNTYNNAKPGNTATANEISLTSSGFQIMLTGTYLDDSGFNVFAKVGGIDEKTNSSGTLGSNVTGYQDITKWAGAAAGGIGYMPMQDLNITLQYEHVFGSNAWDSTGGATNEPNYGIPQNAVTLGLTYKFGSNPYN